MPESRADYETKTSDSRKTSDLKKDFGTLVRELREMRGWTQQQLGNKIGCYGTRISAWERGVYMPEIASLLDLADAFGVPASKLVEEIE